MKFRKTLLLLAACTTALLMAGCKADDDEAFTGIKFSEINEFVDAGKTVNVTATYYKDDSADTSSTIAYSIADDTTDGAALGSVSGKSGQAVDLTLGSKSGGLVRIKAECNGYSAYYGVGTTPSSTFSKDDSPFGFASLGVDMSKMTKSITVSTKSDLVSYAKKGGYIVYVKGTIDMSDGILPAEGSTMDGASATDAMNTFIAANSDYSTYADWIRNMTTEKWINSNLNSSGNTSTLAISNTYKNKIMIQIASNTAIIGVDDATIRGIDFSISSSNVVLRNLTLKDAVDPFPHHEAGDGWNAQHDIVCISGGKNVWIDHCTFQDTMHCGTAANGEKWQVYDGLCDMKSTATNITVSNCIFRDHDKTMLIGSSDSDGADDKTARKVTLAYNYWIDCGQRCPMVRNTLIHVLNNMYDSQDRYYTSQSSINARAGSVVCAENCYFGGVTTPAEGGGTIYYSPSTAFTPVNFYPYVNLNSSKVSAFVKANAGAGKLSVSIN